MQFVESSIADVKSIAQRALVLHWSRAAAGRALPNLEDFQPPSRGHDPNLMVIWRVDYSADGPEFRAMFQGDHIAVAFRQRWEGRSMAEMIPESLRAAALDGARFCVEQRLAPSTWSIPRSMPTGSGLTASGFCFRSGYPTAASNSFLRRWKSSA